MNKLTKFNAWLSKGNFSSLKSAQGYLRGDMPAVAPGASYGSSCGGGDDKPKASACGASDDK
jgi:hypothetical protein